MQTYQIGPATIILERDSAFTPVTLNFEFCIDFDSIVPETNEDAYNYHNSIARVSKFLQGINNAFILETNYPETELFVTSRINNISIEVPEGCNKIPLIGLMFFHKVDALLGDYELKSFSLSFNLTDASTDQIKTKLDYTAENIEGTKLQSILTHYEEIWGEEMESDLEEMGDSLSEEDKDTTPWWHRNDGQVRDFINMDVESFDHIKEDSTMIRILTVDLEDEDFPEYDPTEPDDGTPTEPSDDGYYKV